MSTEVSPGRRNRRGQSRNIEVLAFCRLIGFRGTTGVLVEAEKASLYLFLTGKKHGIELHDLRRFGNGTAQHEFGRFR